MWSRRWVSAFPQEYAVSSTVSACGEEDSDQGRKLLVKPASMKQEVSIEHV